MALQARLDCDYIVVGSGAGGGTVAARLAEAGMRVTLLEAGGDARESGGSRLPEDYDVPAFHAFASENPAMSWNFNVQHYADPVRQRRDPKWGPEGILYPRAGTLGGCTAHNASILVCPHDSDWDGIAALTGDASWRASHMRRYFRRLEDCRHRPLWRLLRRFGIDPTGHGWAGWLRTEHARPQEVIDDPELLRLVIEAARIAIRGGPRPWDAIRRLFEGHADPNDRRMLHGGSAGICYTPLATNGHRRTGTRERVLEVAARYAGRLQIELNALASRVIFDGQNRAIGVEYLKGERLYRADAAPSMAAGERREVSAARGVILAGGSFNSPQLLMLSGIGPREELERHGIPVRVDLPGVGRNLQDRYEIGVVNRMARSWQILEKARFERNDELHQAWLTRRTGMYISNGAAIGVSRRSNEERVDADLFCMALLANFTGYYPGYSRKIAEHNNYLTWAILKAHTINRAGTVTLRSPDPRDMPLVNFRYFDEGNDPAGDDLRALLSGIRFVRDMAKPLKDQGLIAEEELPGSRLQSDDELAAYVRDNAWGHHASCSCAIGARAAGGVLESGFTVHGTQGLRVVDASIFPRIPGFFIACAVYMIAEKAADVILAEDRVAPVRPSSDRTVLGEPS